MGYRYVVIRMEDDRANRRWGAVANIEQDAQGFTFQVADTDGEPAGSGTASVHRNYRSALRLFKRLTQLDENGDARSIAEGGSVYLFYACVFTDRGALEKALNHFVVGKRTTAVLRTGFYSRRLVSPVLRLHSTEIGPA